MLTSTSRSQIYASPHQLIGMMLAHRTLIWALWWIKARSLKHLEQLIQFLCPKETKMALRTAVLVPTQSLEHLQVLCRWLETSWLPYLPTLLTTALTQWPLASHWTLIRRSLKTWTSWLWSQIYASPHRLIGTMLAHHMQIWASQLVKVRSLKHLEQLIQFLCPKETRMVKLSAALALTRS